MKKISILLLAGWAFLSCGKVTKVADDTAGMASDTSVVFFTQEISPVALVHIYEALGRPATGKVAVKISTGEAGGHNYLKPELISGLVSTVGGTIVECNTAYNGKRNTTAAHWETIREHGFTDIAPVDIMDEEGDMRIPVKDSTWIKYDIVGSHLADYDFMINLAHFKGHAMGGFGGVLKNQSIGVASASGKAYIHSAGRTGDVAELWSYVDNQDGFLESMAAAAQAVHGWFGNGERIVYINVVNNLSVDCDCDSHPAAPEMNDIGILASLDPVALDQACLDMVFAYPSSEGDNAAALIERINSRHGVHTVEYAAAIGLGNRCYRLVQIDGEDMLRRLNGEQLSLVVRNHGITSTYTQHGVKDLMTLVADGGNILQGAVVADKTIGKAAAALMIVGGVKTAYTNTICTAAKQMLTAAGVNVYFEKEIPMVMNREQTGQCPMDAALEGIDDAVECVRRLQMMQK